MAYLHAPVDGIYNVQSLSRHGRVKSSLEVAQISVFGAHFTDGTLVDIVGEVFIRGFPASSLGHLDLHGSGLLLLCHLGLGQWNLGVRSRGHHRACHDRTVSTNKLGEAAVNGWSDKAGCDRDGGLELQLHKDKTGQDGFQRIKAGTLVLVDG